MTDSSSPIRIDDLLRRVAKPARYSGGEWNSVHKDWDAIDMRVLLAYPDTYEIGSSHLGLQILYELVNARDDALAERAYAPWLDMSALLGSAGLPLFSLETRRPAAAFDILGFTLPYELTYTNVLDMLRQARLPLRAADRSDADTLVISGGSCAFNPEPLASFIDLFVIGDGEGAINDLLDALRDSDWRPRHASARSRARRASFLRHAARISGVYVPELYGPKDKSLGSEIVPQVAIAPRHVLKRFASVLPFNPVRPVVPYLQPVHDRAAVEIMRGCARGCRFCQAGMIYRSVRERSIEETLSLADQLLANTGYEELALVSLSSADHSQITAIVHELVRRHPDLNVSLPSLRVDAFSVDLAKAIRRRRGSFTFAPEAGSQHLRDVINKHVSEEDALNAAHAAFGNGWSQIKLYFMIGLPDETMADVAGIAALAKQMLAIGRRHQGHRAQIHVSVNSFSPKAHTPFQWLPQDTGDNLREKQALLRTELRGIKLNWSDNRVSFLEAAIARGDRKVGEVIYNAFLAGARFDAWSDCFRHDLWEQAFASAGCDQDHYTHRARALDEVLPWDHIESGVSKAFLKKELERSVRAEFTPDCHVHDACSACGYFKANPECMEKAQRVQIPAHI